MALSEIFNGIPNYFYLKSLKTGVFRVNAIYEILFPLSFDVSSIGILSTGLAKSSATYEPYKRHSLILQTIKILIN